MGPINRPAGWRAVRRASGGAAAHKRRRKARSGWPGLAPLRARLTPRRVDIVLVVALCAAAAAIRWPNLLRLPHFTDETVEIEWALGIWRGEILPLTASDRYYGPLHPYLVAGMLGLFGPSPWLPRLIVLVFGALTVGLTYWLGRALADRRVGFVGAALLATAPQHIVVNSHVAWQNSTTPFYATLTFLLLAVAVRAGLGAGYAPAAWIGPRAHAGWCLTLAGAAYGLTLHTHPGTIVLAPALALAFLIAVGRARAWRVLRTPWPWLAPIAGLLAYSPVLLHNLANDLPGVRRVQTQRNYAYESQLSWGKYWRNEGDLWLEFLRLISNPFRIPEERWHYLTSPYLLIMAALCALGVALLARRGATLPLWAIGCTAAIMPAFNKAYGQPWDRYLLTGRYIAFLLPLAYLAVAAAALFLLGQVGAALAARVADPRPRAAVALATGALLALLVAYPLQPLARYYAHEGEKDPANASFLATVAFLRATHDGRAPIIIGRKLSQVDLKDGADAREIFDLLLDLDGLPHVSPQNTRHEVERQTRRGGPGQPAALPLVIMTRDECWQMGANPPFQRVSERYRLRELYWALPSYYAVYRPTPDGEPGGCAPPTGPEPGE